MRKTLTFILGLIGFLSFGQENKLAWSENLISKIEPETLENLYVNALNSRIDLLLENEWQYIEMNEYGSRIKNLNISDRYKFLTTDELIDLSIKEKRTIDVLRLIHKVISKDTIDINFGHTEFRGKRKLYFHKGIRFKKAEITVSCSGTNGYQPDIRYAYDNLNNEWKIVKN